jgi:hypothetical protein
MFVGQVSRGIFLVGEKKSFLRSVSLFTYLQAEKNAFAGFHEFLMNNNKSCRKNYLASLPVGAIVRLLLING